MQFSASVIFLAIKNPSKRPHCLHCLPYHLMSGLQSWEDGLFTRFLSIEYNPTLLWLMLLTRRFYPGDGELNIEICWNNCNFLSNIPFIITL